MVRRIDRYKIKPGDDLGDPDVLTTIFEDLDNRLHAQELNGQAIDERADHLEQVALSRLNDVFTGVLRDAQGKLQDTGAWFKAESQTSFIPETGAQQFILTEETRGGYVSTRDILIVSASDDTHFLVAKLVSYVPLDGTLDVNITDAFGENEKSDWLIYPLAVAESGHIVREDNPHKVTAEQVGAYTKAEIDQAIQAARDDTDQAIAAAKDDIRSGATAAYDTLHEIEQELNSGSTARAALTTQIAGKLGNGVDTWLTSADGKGRINFSANSTTSFKSGHDDGHHQWLTATGVPMMYLHRSGGGILDLFGNDANTGGAVIRFFDGPSHAKVNWQMSDVDGVNLDIHEHNGGGAWTHHFRINHNSHIYTPAYGWLHNYFMVKAVDSHPYVIFHGPNAHIYRSNKIASVQRLGVGFYQINFVPGTFIDASYGGAGSGQKDDHNSDGNVGVQVGGSWAHQQGVNHTYVWTGRGVSNEARDIHRICVVFFGGR